MRLPLPILLIQMSFISLGKRGRQLPERFGAQPCLAAQDAGLVRYLGVSQPHSQPPTIGIDKAAGCGVYFTMKTYK